MKAVNGDGCTTATLKGYNFVQEALSDDYSVRWEKSIQVKLKVILSKNEVFTRHNVSSTLSVEAEDLLIFQSEVDGKLHSRAASAYLTSELL